MSDLDFQERVDIAVDRAEEASAIMDQFAHAPATAVIPTRSGPIKPLAHYQQQITGLTDEVDLLVLDVANLLDTLP